MFRWLEVQRVSFLSWMCAIVFQLFTPLWALIGHSPFRENFVPRAMPCSVTWPRIKSRTPFCRAVRPTAVMTWCPPLWPRGLEGGSASFETERTFHRTKDTRRDLVPEGPCPFDTGARRLCELGRGCDEMRVGFGFTRLVRSPAQRWSAAMASSAAANHARAKNHVLVLGFRHPDVGRPRRDGGSSGAAWSVADWTGGSWPAT
jgi:hypothetical protein